MSMERDMARIVMGRNPARAARALRQILSSVPSLHSLSLPGTFAEGKSSKCALIAMSGAVPWSLVLVIETNRTSGRSMMKMPTQNRRYSPIAKVTREIRRS